MDINKMHEVFRTLGQQNGMQMIRAILPETIDVYLNGASISKVRDYVKSNVNTDTRGRVITNAQINPINGLRTLFKKKEVTVGAKASNKDFYLTPIVIDKVCFYTSFAVEYDNHKTKKCRFIEGDELYDTMADYCNAPSVEHPVITMYSDDANKEITELYINHNTRIPQSILVSYIELPRIVKWTSNINDRVDSNLPEYMHHEIVQIAVNTFLQSISSASQS